MARRPPQLPEGHARRTKRTGAAPVHDDGEVGGRVARAFHLRRSRRRRGAPSRAISRCSWSRAVRPTTIAAARGSRTAPCRFMSYQPFRVDMQSRLHDDRRQGPLRSHGSHQRRRAVQRSPATSTSAALARAALSASDRASTFPTQKNIFFHGQKFNVSGTGDFTGTFHLFKGGRELKGTFTSPVAGVNDWRFPNLRGSVPVGARSSRDHERDERAVRRHRALRLSHGAARQAGTPAKATWDVQYHERRSRAS